MTPNYATDPQLGSSVHNVLKELGLETPMTEGAQEAWLEGDAWVIEKGFRSIMTQLGLDLQDDSLRETPKRVAKMFCEEIFSGLNYANFPKCTTFKNRMVMDEMIAVQTHVYSNCEHHFQPFIGTCWVGYLPNADILGASKFNRVVDFFARRPQVQERLTE